MKQIQKGFTLIELMIVVAIIGILAAVAIPAYQDYIVKAKLSKVVSTLDPVKTALAMYFQEQGGFPNMALDTVANDFVGATGAGAVGQTPAGPTVSGSVWASLGFGNYPSLPNEVASMALFSAGGTAPTASNISLILELKNVKAATVDGAWISLSPNTQGNATGAYEAPLTATTTTIVSTDTISGASAINWYYGCKKGASQTGTVVDAVVKNFFKNGNAVLVC